MQIASLGSSGISRKHQIVKRSRYVYCSCSGNVAVENRVVFLLRIQRFHAIESDSRVENHVPEMIPQDAAANRSLRIEPVPYIYVLEHHSLRTEAHRSVGDVLHVREIHLHARLIQS